MARPITWQTVRGASLAEAAAPMDSAAELINKGLGQFKSAQEDYVEQDKTRNTQAFLNQINQIRDPEAYRQAFESGELDSMLQQYGPYIDMGQAREAMNTRGTALRDRDLSIDAFNQNIAARAARPHIEAAGELINSGRFEEADAYMAQHPEVNWTDLMGQRRTLANEIEDRNLRNRSTRLGSDLTQLQIDTARKENTKNQTKEAIEREFLSSFSDSNATVDKFLTDAAPLGVGFGIPTTASGKLNLSKATPEQRNAFLIAARSQGYDIPTADTDLVNQTTQKMLQDNRDPILVNQVKSSLLEAGKLTTEQQLVGSDKTAYENIERLGKQAKEESAERNPYIGLKTNPKYSGNGKYIALAMDHLGQGDDADSHEAHEVAAKAAQLELQTFPDASGNVRSPTVEEILYAITMTENGRLSNPSFHLVDRLKEIMRNPEMNKLKAEADLFKLDNPTQIYRDTKRILGN